MFCSLPGGLAREVETRLGAEGHYVFSNARDNRMEADVPLLIPEVNHDHARAITVQQRARGWSKGFVVTNPNCSTIHFTLALKPLWDAFGIEQLMVTTLQASSGAGYPGVPSLDLIDNVVPYIGGEEEKMEIESRKLLGAWDGADFQYADMSVSASCHRVPVRHGHTEAVNVKLRRSASPPRYRGLARVQRPAPRNSVCRLRRLSRSSCASSLTGRSPRSIATLPGAWRRSSGACANVPSLESSSWCWATIPFVAPPARQS